MICHAFISKSITLYCLLLSEAFTCIFCFRYIDGEDNDITETWFYRFYGHWYGCTDQKHPVTWVHWLKHDSQEGCVRDSSVCTFKLCLVGLQAPGNPFTDPGWLLTASFDKIGSSEGHHWHIVHKNSYFFDIQSTIGDNTTGKAWWVHNSVFFYSVSSGLTEGKIFIYHIQSSHCTSQCNWFSAVNPSCHCEMYNDWLPNNANSFALKMNRFRSDTKRADNGSNHQV